ncbi:DUF1848 family protein [Clostridium tetani]|uniref:DUF1848 family protein n=1 Tax=Clostridium tetani TaxID=1513 RepID=UPI00100A7ECE|nr:DUF1848 family protein [Clostridium tetani]RXM73600.1 hypothetical protein DP143_04370 [Clostridium tetani]
MQQISLFNNYENNKNIKPDGIILSASRMTDMPKFYPNELIKETQKRLDNGNDIHTIVLWSKHPSSLLIGELNEYLNLLKNKGVQLYYQCTITGMGGRVIGKNRDGTKFILEPGVPKPYAAISDLKKVIKLLESPLRIKLRIDPIVKIKNKYTGDMFSNISLAEEVIKETSKLGVKNYTFSFLESGIHNKVDYRFNRYDWSIITPNIEEKEKVYKWFKNKAEKYNVNIESCCVPGLPESRCIDGYLLNKLHDLNKIADLKEPRKRQICACTHSIDIGGWPPKKCYSGCKYCYANAKI